MEPEVTKMLRTEQVGWIKNSGKIFDSEGCRKQIAKVFMGFEKMLIQNTLLPRWSDEIKNHAYSEDEKQCLNGMICWFLAQYSVKAGKNVDFTFFPKIAIWRGFEKYVKKDIREEIFEKIRKKEPAMIDAIDEHIRQVAVEMTTEEFVEFIGVPEKAYERQIYKAATAIATYIEFLELNSRVYISTEDLERKERSQMERCKKYSDVPGFEKILLYKGDLYRLFEHFSKLRNQVRWVGIACKVKFNDLGHSYHAACLAYVNILSNGGSEEEATEAYFTMLFHDIAERWTGDFSSPKKKIIKIKKGNEIHVLGEYVEDIEREMLREHVYTRVPEEMLEPFMKIMLEEMDTVKLKRYKEADSLSAILEGYANIEDGGGDEYFINFIDKEFEKKEWSWGVKVFLEELKKHLEEIQSDRLIRMIDSAIKRNPEMKETLKYFLKIEN